MQKKQKHRKRQNNYILYNLIYLIGGTAKLRTDDIVNKSVVFRITETSCHIIHVSKTGENFSNSKVPESDWKGNFCVSRKSIYELCTKLQPYLQKKQNHLRSPMSVEVQVGYYITVEGPIGKLQMLLVFLGHHFRL